MVSINLLPWRELQRVHERNGWRRILLASLLLALLMLIAAHVWLSVLQRDTEKQILEHKIQMQRLRDERQENGASALRSAPQSVIEKMLAYRADTQRVMTRIGKQHPYHVCFTEITRSNNVITITGNARSAMELTEFLKHWEAVELFSEIKIEQLELQPETQLMIFRLAAIERVMLPREALQTRKLDDVL